MYKNTQADRFKNYPDLLRWRAEEDGNRLAYCFLQDGKTESQRLTFRELNDKVQLLAGFLQKYNCENERALVILENDLDYLIAFFACLYSKTIAVTLHPPSSREQLFRLNQVIKDCSPKFVLCNQSIHKKLNLSSQKLFEDIQVIEVDQVSKDSGNSWLIPTIEPSDLAFLQYTSGSTSSPKGVMVSHYNLLCQGEYIQQAMSITKQDIAVMWLPYFHDMGLILGALQGPYTGYATYLMTPLTFIKSPLVWLKALSKYGGTLTAAPNFAYDLCCESFDEKEASDLDLSSLKCALNGAEPVRKKTLDKFTELFKPFGFESRVFYPAYGMAETTLVVSGGKRENEPTILDVDSEKIQKNHVTLADSHKTNLSMVSCGSAHLETVIRIVDPKTLKMCPRFSIGEIYVKNKSITLGYWKNEKATKECFGIYIEGEGPFFKTGDLGFLDEEGELYITGRCKDIIIINGRNHAPQDIELTVQESHPAIRANFVGAFSVDQNSKERLVVVAGIKPDHVKALKGAEIYHAISKRVASAHEIRVEDLLLIRRGELPRTTSGKIQRSLCRKKYLNNEFKTFYKHSLENTFMEAL